METFLIIFTVIVVVGFTILSFYTSINGGAEHFEKWLKRRSKKNF
jgi:uncharacterized protein HemY